MICALIGYVEKRLPDGEVLVFFWLFYGSIE
jgi:hypothetical protein